MTTELGSDAQLARIGDTSGLNSRTRAGAWRSALEEWRVRLQTVADDPGADYPDPDETPPGDPPEYDPLPPG